MLFRRLVESNARATFIASLEGYAVSVVAHAAVIGSTVFVTTRDVKPSDLANSFSPVAFFIPKDRIIGSRPRQERITYMSTAAPGGSGNEVQDEKATKFRSEPVEPGPGLTELASKASEEQQTAPESTGDSVMTVLQVDSAAARYDDSAAPPYPPRMLEKRIEGSVGIQYVVDTTGAADIASIVILSATHPDFAESVKHTLPEMRFRPAVMNGRKVRQLVQQMFAFKIDTTMLAAQAKKQDRKH
ncbi:MAG: TonB family protein [Gemmatimonadaceae bacterium]|nr:TonB family protein [Gemmatimonadaceae bacterium]